MKIAAIICEYNPMQNGHVYHLSKALKETQAERVVCIMSGNFTQRGEIAVADKYARAAWAVKNGADAVVELPPQYVLTTAKYFALGGVKIANLIKGDVVLSFGSECGDIEKVIAMRFGKSRRLTRKYFPLPTIYSPSNISNP